jgi:hypothetical protein
MSQHKAEIIQDIFLSMKIQEGIHMRGYEKILIHIIGLRLQSNSKKNRKDIINMKSDFD